MAPIFNDLGRSGGRVIATYGSYIPWRAHKELGGNSSNYPEFSGRIFDLKNGRRTAVEYFCQRMEPDLGDEFAIAVVPSHDPESPGSGLRQLAAKLAQHGNRSDASECLVRTVKIEELSQGGDRSIGVHIRSIAVARAELVEGRDVLLLDDVTSSGNSLLACRHLLLHAGAKEVQRVALAQTSIAGHFADDSMTGVAATASSPEPAPAAAQQSEARLAEERRRAEEARHAEEALGAADPTEVDLDHLTAADAPTEQKVVGGEAMNDRTEKIKRRAAEIAAEIAAETAEIEEDMRSAIFDLGMQNLAAFRKKVDAAGITQILQETPRIKVYDHDHAYGFHLGKMEYAVFADWDSGRLCRDVCLEEGTRSPRITDFDHDDALNEMVDCLARMLATIEAGGAAPKPNLFISMPDAKP